MANNQYINKVVYGNQVLLDLTSDTIEADKLLKGFTAHKANGEPIVGTYEGGGEGYTINLTASSSELYGQDIVVSYEGQRITTIQFSNTGTASIVVQEEGAYNFAVSYGGLTYYCDVNVVSAIVTYNETIYYYPNGSIVTPVNDVQIWISCADVRDKNYTTLAEVFADVQLLATLMASENAVNYLVRSKQFIESEEAFVPVMTSATTPSGEVVASSFYISGNEGYLAFDGADNTGWSSGSSDTSPTIGYIGTSTNIAKRVSFILGYRTYSYASDLSATLQGYDGVNWANIDVISFPAKATSYEGTDTFSYLVNNSNTYIGYRLKFNHSTRPATTDYLSVRAIQFYSESGVTKNQTAMSYIGANDYCTNTLLADSEWREAICNSEYFESVLNVKVPTMTSNTTPSGVASASSTHVDANAPYKAFDGSTSSWHSWVANQTGNYLRYDFGHSVNIAKYSFLMNRYQATSAGTKNIAIQISDDAITWNNIDTFSVAGGTTDFTRNQNISGTNSFRYIQIYTNDIMRPTDNAWNMSTKEFQIYGRQNGGVQTWLRLAGITDKTYTTLSEVFADSATLSTLMANHDAVDYLVTCKGWATEVCSNQSAMSYIGLNNYCANTLLADATWRTAICNSTYFESVLNVKVPTMTSDTTPSGECFASDLVTNPYRAFDNVNSTVWQSTVGSVVNQYVGYTFTASKRIYKVKGTAYINTSSFHTYTVKAQGSNDSFSSDVHDLTSAFTYSGTQSDTVNIEQNISNVGDYDSYRMICTAVSDSTSTRYSFRELQFYGREDV